MKVGDKVLVVDASCLCPRYSKFFYNEGIENSDWKIRYAYGKEDIDTNIVYEILHISKDGKDALIVEAGSDFKSDSNNTYIIRIKGLILKNHNNETGDLKAEKYINAINQKEDAVFVEFVEGKGYCLTFNTNQKNLHYIIKSLVDCCLLPFNNTITFSHSYERGINRDRFDIVFGIEEDFIKFCENYFPVRTLK